LIGLTLLVLLAHLAFLQGMPMTMGLTQLPPPRPFTTRTLAPVPLLPSNTSPTASPPAKAQTLPPSVPKEPPSTEPAGTEQTTSPDNTHNVPASTVASADTPPADPQPVTPPAETPPPDSPSPAQATVTGQFTLPGTVHIRYTVESNKFPFSANGELLWKQDGKTYDMHQEWGALGISKTRTSRGIVTPAGLAPLRFSDKYRSEVAAHFDREQNKITFSANTPDAALLPGTQDQLSIQAQLAAMLAGNPGHFPAGASFLVQVVGPRAADIWVIGVVGEERLTLPGGELATLKLVRNPSREFDQRLELWMAPSLGYLPARLRITETNGDYVDQKWLATEPQP